jgi:dihydrofolate reductase
MSSEEKPTPKLCHIVAMSNNRVIGKGGKLPWHLKTDLQYFKQVTMDACLIMGRKTFDSIGKALPGRFSIVLSRSTDVMGERVATVQSIDAAVNLAKNIQGFRNDRLFVIGGGEVYRSTMELVDEIYLTLVEKTIEGDTVYPEFDLEKYTLAEDRLGEDGVRLRFRHYVRKTSV